MAVLGIDFGTSNSAAGVAVGGQPWLINLEPGATTLPTAVFFPEDRSGMRIGERAVRALISGEDGRFMRALKSLLGTPLLHEERRFYGQKMTFADIVSGFLADVKARAEAATHQSFDHALSGRPVRFHSSDETRNARAEADLRACYLAAGFTDVKFMFEPEAALRATPAQPGLGMIVDIGGGTTDFTVFEQGDSGAARILASFGVRIGGTDFDRQLSIDHVMPLLGRGSGIRNSFGGGSLPAPNRLFNDLATWQMIPFLYAPEPRRAVADLARHAVEPEKLARFRTVLDDELGHDLAFAVEAGKIHANDAADTGIRIGMIERGLSAPLSPELLEQSLSSSIGKIRQAACDALALADVQPERISRLVMVGGSSLMTALRRDMQFLCPSATIETGNAMTAVADGLALSAEHAFS
ncbi:Hsp70 family protein [Falsiphaeobacter marinintestinus]|uniref:Hsp70 family protein n=1 Tax=Falsiphaeobacter marinintestinus TaxID=1492905 RepID=UPI0011B72E70|nr:Hsp70 family protein [Phaeobacter marinintestinus]